MTGRSKGLTAIAATVAVACSSGGSETVAGIDIEETCAQFEAAGSPIERRVIETDLFEQLEDEPADDEMPPLLAVLAGMREHCPEVVDSILGTADAELVAGVDVDLASCGSKEVAGTVTNGNDETVTVRLLVRLTDSSDVLIDTSTTTVSGLEPGQTGKWDVYVSDSYDRCRVLIDKVTAS